MKLEHILTDDELEEWKASREVCRKHQSGGNIGASALASCKAQGLVPRSGKKKITIGKKRSSVGGKKIKGYDYGGPYPYNDYNKGPLPASKRKYKKH